MAMKVERNRPSNEWYRKQIEQLGDLEVRTGSAPQTETNLSMNARTHAKRFYFETQNGMHVSLRAQNGLLAVKQLPKWVLL